MACNLPCGQRHHECPSQNSPQALGNGSTSLWPWLLGFNQVANHTQRCIAAQNRMCMLWSL